MTDNKGETAFPVPDLIRNGHIQYGMTLRDYFAAKAMQGLLSDSEIQGTPNEFALRSYAMADAMLKEREA